MPKAVNDLTVSNRLVMPGSLAVERSVAQHRAFRNVASLDTGASATVGAIVVQTKITGSVMFRAHLQGYHYQSTTDRLLDSVVVGYATSGPVVSRSGVVHYGPSQPVVQVGFNASGELAIILAGIAAIWNYFRLHVPLAVLGYSAPTEAMAAGWTVTQATDLSPWTTGFATVPSITPGAAPTGSATGDLSGSYPAPVVAKASGASFDLPAATVQRFTGKPAATTDIIRSQVGAEAQNRLVVQADGRHTWGDGAAAGDTNLYRSGPDQLKTDDALEVAGLLQLNSGLLIPAGAGAGKVLTSDASGNATWDDPDLAEYALGTTTAAVVSLLTGAWIKVPAGVVTTETPDAASCLRWNSDGTITILQDGWYSFYALFERGGATNAGVQWGFWYNSSDVSPANPAAFWRNELPAQTYYIDQASMCWRFSAGQRVGVSAYNRSATTYTATVMLSVARIGAGVEGPKGDKGDPGITDYAFKPGNWCDQLTGVLANTWVTLPTKSGATPPTIEPAGAFVENADSSITIRDAGWYLLEATVSFTAAGNQHLTIGTAPGVEGFYDRVTETGAGAGAFQHVATVVEVAAGQKVYFTAASNVVQTMRMMYMAIARVGAGPAGPKGDPGPGGTPPMQSGTATCIWPGGTSTSTPLVVNHNLGVIPDIQVTPREAGAALTVTARTSTTFTVQARHIDATLIGAGSTTTFMWLAVPADTDTT